MTRADCLAMVKAARIPPIAYRTGRMHTVRVSADVCCPDRHAGTGTDGMSSGDCAGKLPATFTDMDRFRRAFPEVVAQWLRAHFRDKEHVAYFFDRDERTARNWLAGVNTPSGADAVAMVLQFPDLRARVEKAMRLAA